MLPPGPKYVAKRLPPLLVPLAGIHVLNRLAGGHYDVTIPRWLLILIIILAIPTTAVLKAKIKELRDKRAAKAYGAVLAPVLYDPLPGGLGLMLDQLKQLKTGYPDDYYEERISKYGMTWNCRVFWEDRFATIEPDYVKAILATQFDSFEKGPVFHSQLHSLLGSGVFNSDGDMWKFHRAMTRPFFSRDRITHFEIFDRHIKDAFSQIKARLREGYPVDIQDAASRFTMDSATEFLFAKDVQSLSAGLPYPHYAAHLQPASFHTHPANAFAQAFDEAQRGVAFRNRYGAAWPLSEFWSDKVKQKMGPVYQFLDPILESAVERRKASGREEVSPEKSWALPRDREINEDESLLDHLVNYTSDKTLLRDETLNILLAGRDTTANTITYSVYMLARHRNVFERLRAEVLGKLGTDRLPTFEDMKDMKYLRAVINETLRLYPAVPFNLRMSNKEVILPGKNGGPNLYIPANTRISYSVFMMHRRKDLWGPDAHLYDPDRFIDERLHKYLTPNPFIFVPFNAGPRICLGQQFAYHETSYFLIRLLQTFSAIELAPEAQPPETVPPSEWKNVPGTKSDSVRPKVYLTMSILGGCWIRLREADSEA